MDAVVVRTSALDKIGRIASEWFYGISLATAVSNATKLLYLSDFSAFWAAVTSFNDANCPFSRIAASCCAWRRDAWSCAAEEPYRSGTKTEICCHNWWNRVQHCVGRLDRNIHWHLIIHVPSLDFYYREVWGISPPPPLCALLWPWSGGVGTCHKPHGISGGKRPWEWSVHVLHTI